MQSGSPFRQTRPSRVVSGLCLGRWLREVTRGKQEGGIFRKPQAPLAAFTRGRGEALALGLAQCWDCAITLSVRLSRFYTRMTFVFEVPVLANINHKLLSEASQSFMTVSWGLCTGSKTSAFPPIYQFVCGREPCLLLFYSASQDGSKFWKLDAASLKFIIALALCV